MPVSILLVEDEVISLSFLASTLAKKYPDFEIHQAPDGKAGLELFLERKPDIVITDLNMPKMNGVEMSSRIRAMNLGTRFIALTGERENDLYGTQLGTVVSFDFFLDKPILIRDLFDAIEQCSAQDTFSREVTGRTA
jgi:YesN/AraC family two-component response regulator